MRIQKNISAHILAISAALWLSPGASALPQGDNVTHGVAPVDYSNSGMVIINQSTPKAVIHWAGYNIGAGETVQHNMPNNGAVVNITTQSNPSFINGNLFSNGTVYIINPHGILFGSNANVKVGSLIASSLAIDPDEFFASSGALNFFGGAGGSVINNGIIEASTGSVALLGESITNSGHIKATAGSITLATGTQMTLDFDGNGLIQVAVNDTVKQNLTGASDAILNEGRLDSNRVTLEARAAAGIFTNAVNHTGQIIALKLSVSSAGDVALIGEGAPVNVDPGALLIAESGVTISEIPGSPPPPPAPPAPPAPPVGSPSADGSDSDTPELGSTLASTVNPVEGSESASVNSVVVGLYSVEGEGVRLPADQLEEPL